MVMSAAWAKPTVLTVMASAVRHFNTEEREVFAMGVSCGLKREGEEVS
jgi:hypothetical protein